MPLNNPANVGGPSVTESPQELDDRVLGRAAAQEWWKRWKRARHNPPTELRSAAFACAALDELVLLQDDTAEVLQEQQENSARSAEQMHIDPYRGILEVIQNADDLGATEVRLAVHEMGDSRTLIVSHDGRPVRLRDVIGISQAYLSTKTDDPTSKGRFGIGLKTLRSIATGLAVHNEPWHFRVADWKGSPIVDGSDRDFADGDITSLVLPLKPLVTVEDMHQWLRTHGPSSLLFLSSVRRLTLSLDGDGATPTIELVATQRKQAGFSCEIGDAPVHVERKTVTATGTDVTWELFSTNAPSPPDVWRANKATGTHVNLGVAVASKGTGKVYAGLPTETSMVCPISIHSEFDLDPSRRDIPPTLWNDRLLLWISDLIARCSSEMAAQPHPDVWTIPLTREASAASDDYFGDGLRGIVERVHENLRRTLQLSLGDSTVPLDRVVYPVPSVAPLLTTADIAYLHPPEKRRPP